MLNLVELEYELHLGDIRDVFHHILDKLDKQPSSLRNRKIKIPIDYNNIPSLYSPKEYQDDKKIEEALNVLVGRGIFDIEERQKEKYRAFCEKEKAKLVFNCEFEDALRDFYSRDKKIDDWGSYANSDSIDDSIKDIIIRNKISIPNKTSKEIIDRLQNLLLNEHTGKSVRHISAKYFWGISKVLDNKEQIIEFCKLKPMPILLHVKSMNNKSTKILFIENQDTYIEALNSEKVIFKDYILIFSSGFKASSKRLRKREGSKIFFEDECYFNMEDRINFKKWLYEEVNTNPDVYFWGDLDFSGVLIFSTLRKIFPKITMYTKGYNDMLMEIENGNGHLPEMASKENQKDPKMIDDSYCDEVLLPAIRKYAFYDQEGVEW